MANGVPVALLAVLMLAGCTGLPPSDAQTAEHRMTLTVEPDGDGRYTLDVPFLVHHRQEEARMGALEKLRETVQVTVGDGTFEWTDNQTRMIVQGEGAMTLEVNRTFSGEVREREAFFDWRLESTEIRRIGTGGLGVEIVWDIDFSGGEGHSCWAWETYTAYLGEGEQTVDLTGTESGANGSWIGLCQ